MKKYCRYVDNNGVVRFHPAYKLTDGSLERQGRKPKNKS